MFPEPKYFAALTTLAIAAVVAQAPAAYAAYSTVGAAHYDAARKAIVVPYSGAFPTFVTDSLGGPPRVYFDFDAAANLRGLHEAAVYGHPSLVRWAMAPKPGNKVRLVLTFKTGTKVLLLNDASHHQMILIPQGVQLGGAAMTSMVGAAPVTVPWKAGQPHTFKQTFGTTDFDYTVGPRAKGAKRDSVNVNVKSNGVTDFHVQSDPAHDAVSFSISIKGQPTTAMVGGASPRPTPRATVRPTARPQMTPSPSPLATPQPLPTPEPLPTPAPTSTPAPLPSPTPLPSPSPTATPATTSQGPGFIVSLRGGYPYSMSESFTGATGNTSSLDTSTSPASVEGGELEARFLDSWAVQLGGDYDRLRTTDNQTTGATAHDRDEIEGNLGVGYRFTPGGTEEMFGLGVFGRYLSVSNVLAATDAGISAPANETPLTAATQLYVGPQLFTRLDFPFGPVGIELKGNGSYLFGMLSPVAQENSGLIGFSVVPSLYLRLGPVQVSAGYQYESVLSLGGSYNYTRSGPLARLDLRF